MKKKTSICLLFTFFFMFAGMQAGAQNQKIGYVDTEFILSKIPEYQNIQRELSQLSEQWRTRLDEMQEEINKLKEDFSAKEILYTDKIRKQREEEIQDKVKQREQYIEQKFGSKGEYFTTQQELLEPVQQRVFQAISAIANREKFDFVFDRAQNTSILYSDSKWNLTNKVLLELGISVEDLSN